MDAINHGEDLGVATIWSFIGQAIKSNAMVLIAAAAFETILPFLLTEFTPAYLRTPIEFVFRSIFGVGYTLIFVLVAQGHQPQLSTLFSQAGRCLKYAVVAFIMGVAIFVGTMFFIAPGLYLMARTTVAQQAFADKNLGPIEALKYSWAVTEGKVMTILTFFASIMVPSFIVVMTLGIAAFIAGFVGVPVPKITEISRYIVLALAIFFVLPSNLAQAYFYVHLPAAGEKLQAITAE